MPVVNELPTQGTRIEIVTGTLRSSAGETALAYPAGFTMDNCIILTVDVYYNDSWETWSFGRFNSVSQIPNPSRFFAYLQSDKIGIEMDMATNNYYYGKPVRVALMKIS